MGGLSGGDVLMAKAADTELRENRVAVMMSNAELAALDDWRFQNRIGSRGEAVRRLIDAGIAKAEGRSDA